MILKQEKVIWLPLMPQNKLVVRPEIEALTCKSLSSSCLSRLLLLTSIVKTQGILLCVEPSYEVESETFKYHFNWCEIIFFKWCCSLSYVEGVLCIRKKSDRISHKDYDISSLNDRQWVQLDRWPCWWHQ